jgi:sulfonate dioxygenase
VVTHRAVPGGYDPATREGKRTAIYGEKPVFDPTGETLSERIQRIGGSTAEKEIVKLSFQSPHV